MAGFESDDEYSYELKLVSADDKEEEDEENDEKEDDKFAQIRIIRPQLTDIQAQRYEKFRCATFGKSNVREIMKRVSKKPANDTIVVGMIGITKIFVGEIVETARSAMDEWNETGPIKPRHIREAYRRLKMANKIPYYKQRRRVFRRYR